MSDSVVGCVVASPTGAVRYWPSAFSEHEFIDVQLDAKDEMCCSVQMVDLSDEARSQSFSRNVYAFLCYS